MFILSENDMLGIKGLKKEGWKENFPVRLKNEYFLILDIPVLHFFPAWILDPNYSKSF